MATSCSTVAVAAHPSLTRDGNDIRMDLPVTLQEAVLGAKVPVPTLTGTVSLIVPPNSNTGTTLRLKGKGIAAHGGQPAGDLYVRLVVTLPDQSRTKSLKSFAEGWDTAYDPRAQECANLNWYANTGFSAPRKTRACATGAFEVND